MTQEMIQMKLLAELKNFGLNPAEWTLHRVHALSYVIQNRIDTGFSLEGRLELKKRRPVWTTLELRSL